MLIVRITGGIGNQLFQYAFARSLSIELNRNFKLDLSWYRNYHKFEEESNPDAATKRTYLLDKFNVKKNLLNPLYLSISYRLNNYSILNKVKKYPVLNYFSYSTITESEFDIYKIQYLKNVYISGFWQKNDLFEKYSDLLKEEFTLKNNLSVENEFFFNKIEQSTSIAIHIRRGDLLSRPAAVAEQPYSTYKYYTKSINIMKEKLEKPELFVFSDDIDWVKNNYNFDLPTTFIDNDGPDYEHFNLMCNCKHQIIANSTFSWWAAWLNNYQDKIIIAPKWWYRDTKKNESIIRIPEDWRILENIEE
jgi:hypothetical protein